MVIWSTTGGPVNVFYAFFVSIEVACTAFIVWYAWTWPRPQPSATMVDAAGSHRAA